MDRTVWTKVMMQRRVITATFSKYVTWLKPRIINEVKQSVKGGDEMQEQRFTRGEQFCFSVKNS